MRIKNMVRDMMLYIETVIARLRERMNPKCHLD